MEPIAAVGKPPCILSIENRGQRALEARRVEDGVKFGPGEEFLFWVPGTIVTT
jgi:hypothetical protein